MNATKQKIYNNFTDKFNNEYKFETYREFSKFWFNLSTRTAKSYFPNNYQKLQNYAVNSKEARTALTKEEIKEAVAQNYN